MSRKSETALSNQVQTWVKVRGGKALKLHGNAFQSAGEPDLIGGVILDGVVVHFAVELKVGDNKPSELQVYRLHEWAKQGYVAGVVWSLDEFVELINRYVNAALEASKNGGRLPSRKGTGPYRRRPANG